MSPSLTALMERDFGELLGWAYCIRVVMTKGQMWHLQRWLQQELWSMGSSTKWPCHVTIKRGTLILLFLNPWLLQPIGNDVTSSYVTSRAGLHRQRNFCLVCGTHTWSPALPCKKWLSWAYHPGRKSRLHERPHTGSLLAPPDMGVRVLPDDSSPPGIKSSQLRP